MDMNFDWLKKLRLGQIFGGQQEQPTFEGPYNPGGGMGGGGGTPPFVPPQGGGGDIFSRVAQMYQPETESIDRYNQMIGQYPTYEEPGKLRKIGGAILGSLTDLGTNFGGNRTNIAGTDVYNETTGRNKFNRKVADWKNQVEPLERSANIERQSNTNNRTMTMQTVSAQLRQEAIDAKEANDQRRSDIAQQRADAYEFKIRNPNVTFDFSTPWVMIKDPKTGTVSKATDSQGRPIATGSMTDQDKISLQQQGRMEVVREQGQNAQDLEATRQGGRQDLQDQRAWSVVNAIDPSDGQQKSFRVNAITGEVQPMGIGAVRSPSASSGGSTVLPTQQRVDAFNKAMELYNTRPDLRPFITLGRPGSNDFEIAKPNQPSSFMGMQFGKAGPTPEQAAELQQLIYGGNRTNVPPPGGAAPAGRGAPPNPGGRGGGPPNSDAMQKSQQLRQRAIDELTKAGRPVTDANIAYVMRQIQGIK